MFDGLFPAIIGTLLVVILSVTWAVPLGIAAGIYLSGYSRFNKIIENKFLHSDGSGVIISDNSHANIIANNMFGEDVTDPIKILCGDQLIQGNIIQEWHGKGIDIEDGRNVIEGNILRFPLSDGTVGIHIGSGRNVIKGNTIEAMDVCIAIYSGYNRIIGNRLLYASTKIYNPQDTFEETVNKSVNDTFKRSIN